MDERACEAGAALFLQDTAELAPGGLAVCATLRLEHPVDAGATRGDLEVVDGLLLARLHREARHAEELEAAHLELGADRPALSGADEEAGLAAVERDPGTFALRRREAAGLGEDLAARRVEEADALEVREVDQFRRRVRDREAIGDLLRARLEDVVDRGREAVLRLRQRLERVEEGNVREDAGDAHDRGLAVGAVGDDAHLVGLHGLSREGDERLAVLRCAGRLAVGADGLDRDDVSAERRVSVGAALRLDVDGDPIVREREVTHADLLARQRALDDLGGVADLSRAGLARRLGAEGIGVPVRPALEAELREAVAGRELGPLRLVVVVRASKDEDAQCGEHEAAVFHDREC